MSTRVNDSSDGMTESTDEASEMLATVEPASALFIGGILGAMTFLLCAFLFGARTIIVIAAVAALIALVRRVSAATVMFAVAAALSTVSSTGVLIAASAMFGVALALFARARMRVRIAAAEAAMRDSDLATRHRAVASD